MTTLAPTPTIDASTPSRATTSDLPTRARRLLLRAWPAWLYGFYVTLGIFFAHCGVLMGDAVSRTVAARMVIQGYDPHLASIGFVWGPIPTVLEFPFIYLNHIWPSLVSLGLAGTFVTAAFGVFGAIHCKALLTERGYSTRVTAIITAGIFLNPFIIIFASNGMSEMPYLALLIAAAHQLSRFQLTGRMTDLAYAGVILGIDCWVRYEPLAAAFGAAVFVGALGWHMHKTESVKARIGALTANIVIVTLPIFSLFLIFIGFSWWLTGIALAQTSSIYGNAAIAQAAGVSTFAPIRVAEVSSQLLHLAPLFVIVFPIALGISILRRGTFFPVIIAVLLPPLLFDIEGLSTGSLLDLIRYLILSIPITVFGLATLTEWRRPGRILLTLGVVVSCIASFLAIGSPTRASQEYAYHQAVLGQPAAQYSDIQLGAAKTIATWLDAQNLPPGSILTDSFLGFMVLSQTKHPNRFVTAPVQAYSAIIQHPYQHGIRYIIAVPPDGTGALYPVNTYYPGLYPGCVNNTQLALEVAGTGTPANWRVYSLTGPITPATALYHLGCKTHQVVFGG